MTHARNIMLQLLTNYVSFVHNHYVDVIRVFVFFCSDCLFYMCLCVCLYLYFFCWLLHIYITMSACMYDMSILMRVILRVFGGELAGVR